jgi:putative chitinase
MILFDRKTFFDAVRPEPFPNMLTQQQVDGMNAIIDEWEARATSGKEDVRHLAYMLATTFHETAQAMWPITEYGSQDYLQGKDYYPYIGRGFVQLTWETNYARATSELGLFGDSDLVAYPDKALDLTIAAAILYRGMIEGWFTGKYLDQYFNGGEDDPVNARQIINGNDKDTLIAGYHQSFVQALYQAEDALVPGPSPEPPEPAVETLDIALTGSAGVRVSITYNGEVILAATS